MEMNKNMKNKKEKIIKIVNIALVIIWMVIVFWFSAQVGDDSSNISGNTLRKIITFINQNISQQELERLVELFQPVIRKLAHYTMYTVGGFLIYNQQRTLKDNKNRIASSTIIGILYAITDEIHQLFVPGRSGRILDVGIDSLGVITGIFIYKLLEKLVNYVKTRRK